MCLPWAEKEIDVGAVEEVAAGAAIGTSVLLLLSVPDCESE